MRYAIIDNSTLTAVERLLGQIPVSDRYALDGDVMAMESLVQAILFYDKLFIVDDYKPEYRSERLKRFSFAIPLEQQEFDYDGLIRRAQALTSSMAPRAHRSLIQDDDFRPFLDMLQMNIAFTWRMSSSVFWLTVNLLSDNSDGEEIHRYSKLWASLVTQLEARSRSEASDAAADRIVITEPNGAPIDLESLPKDEGVGGEVKQFASSLSWLALRTCFYSELAQASGADVTLHPIRHAFRLNMLKRHMGLASDIYSPIFEALSGRIATTTSEILSATDPLVKTMQLPFFSAWLITRTNDPRRILEAAHEAARSRTLSQARLALSELDSLDPSSKEFVRTANKLLRELDHTAARIRSEFGVTTPQGIPTSPVVKVANVALTASSTLPVQIPDLGFKMPMPEWFGRWRDGRRLRSVFRSVVEDLGAIGRLGRLRTLLTSAANIQPGARFSKPSVEESRWFGRSSSVRKWQ